MHVRRLMKCDIIKIRILRNLSFKELLMSQMQVLTLIVISALSISVTAMQRQSTLAGERAISINVQLLEAARDGDHLYVETLLMHSKIKINTTNAIGHTPLILAAMNGHTEVVQALLKAKADVNIGYTVRNANALGWAKARGHSTIVELLRNAGSKEPK
jgi:hypothetical protein